MTIYSGFSHEKWWFSIVMLVYQRVSLRSLLFGTLRWWFPWQWKFQAGTFDGNHRTIWVTVFQQITKPQFSWSDPQSPPKKASTINHYNGYIIYINSISIPINSNFLSPLPVTRCASRPCWRGAWHRGGRVSGISGVEAQHGRSFWPLVQIFHGIIIWRFPRIGLPPNHLF